MIESDNPLDVAIGMRYYSRPDIYLRGLVRVSLSPETFRVYEEIYGLGTARPSESSCPTFHCSPRQRLLAILCKKGISTLEASWILKNLGVRIAYWGIKDAEALSCQFVVAECLRELTLGDKNRRIEELCLYPVNRVSTDFIPRRHQLSGNVFEVALSYIATDPTPILQLIELSARMSYLNYFGYQRFGTVRPISHLVGKAIVAGDYSEALNVLIGFQSDLELPAVKVARKMFLEGDVRGALKTFPKRFTVERSVLRKYIETADPKKAIFQGLPRGMVKFFVEAYQSYLFNKALSAIVEVVGNVDEVGNKCDVLELPRPDLPPEGCGKFSLEVLREDLGVQLSIDKSLFVRAVRETTFRPRDLRIDVVSPSVIELRFKLNRGCYATVYLRELLRENLHIGS